MPSRALAAAQGTGTLDAEGIQQLYALLQNCKDELQEEEEALKQKGYAASTIRN